MAVSRLALQQLLLAQRIAPLNIFAIIDQAADADVEQGPQLLFGLLNLEHVDRLDDPLPDFALLDVALVEPLIRAHGGLERRSRCPISAEPDDWGLERSYAAGAES